MKQRVLFPTLLLLLFTALLTPSHAVFAATTLVGTPEELVAAMTAANLNPDADTIILAGDIILISYADTNGTYGSTALPPVTTSMTIEGQGHTIRRQQFSSVFRIFRIVTGGNLTLYNLTVSGGDMAYANGCSTITITCGAGAFNEGTLNIIHSTFSGNKAIRGGGVYNNAGGILNIINSTFSGNSVSNGVSQQGGGVFTSTGVVTITDSLFSGNISGSLGGAVYNNISTVNISGSTFFGNSATGNGGGVYGTATINRSTFSGNSANFGGAVFVGFQSATISNSTFSGNSAVNQGGAVFFTDSNPYPNTVTVSGSTFSGNQAASGGGIMALSPNMTVRNSIIRNSSGRNCAVLAGGAVNGDGNSLTDNSAGCSGFSNNASINLGTLADNGGATQTFALNNGSAAIDSGSALCSGSDQRGVTRGIDGVGGPGVPQANDCDVGAFEYGATIRTLQFASPSSSILVGLNDTVPVTLALNSTLAQANAVTAYVWVSGGTAVAGMDYVPFGLQTFSIPPGQSTATVTVNLLNPTVDGTIILSFATQNGPGFNGAVQLGAQQIHTITLKTSAPNAASDRNFYDTDTPTLTWTAITGATGYEIQVDTDTAFTGTYSFIDTNIAAGELSITTTHLDNGPYYWRVRAKGGAGVWSAAERIEIFD